MNFEELVLSQGARTEVIHEKISEQHLFYIEPHLEVTIYLSVEYKEIPAEITQNIFSVSNLRV